MMIVITVLAVIGGLVTLYLLMCLTIMEPNEFGVKVVLGKPGDKLTSGWYFAWWPFVKIIKITKKMMMFKFVVQSAVTGRGKVDDYEKIIEPVAVNIECTVYAQFDETQARHIIQYAPGYNAKALGPFLVPYAIDTVRALAGRLPWRLINRERYKSATWVLARLTGGKYQGIDDDDKKKEIKFKDVVAMEEIKIEELEKGKSPFVTLHMKNVSFVIEDLKFPQSVSDSVVAPEKAQLDAQATIITAEATKIKKIKEGEGDATAREKMLSAIKQSPELEALSALKEIGKGSSNFIFSLPKFLEEALSKIVTGGKP